MLAELPVGSSIPERVQALMGMLSQRPGPSFTHRPYLTQDDDDDDDDADVSDVLLKMNQRFLLSVCLTQSW